MNDELERLTALDALDREIERYRADRLRRTARVTGAHEATEAARRTRAEADAVLAQNRTEERALQRRLEELRASRAAAMRVLTTGIGNPEVAERQLEKCDGLIDETETRMLELLEAQDVHVAASARAAAALQDVSGVQADLDSSVPAAVHDIDAAIAALEAHRPQHLAGLPRDLRTRYEAFRARNMHAVAHVKQGACEECRMEVQPQHLADLKRGRLEPCRGCHRWLAI